jgi:hypothetical protein
MDRRLKAVSLVLTFAPLMGFSSPADTKSGL